MSTGYGRKRYLKVVEENALRVLGEHHSAVIIWQTDASARSSRHRYLAVFKDTGTNGIKTAVRGDRVYLWYENTFNSGLLNEEIVMDTEPHRIDLQVISGKEYNKPESVEAILRHSKQVATKKEPAFKTWNSMMKDNVKELKPRGSGVKKVIKDYSYVEDLEIKIKNARLLIEDFKLITPPPEHQIAYDKKMEEYIKALDELIAIDHEMNSRNKQYKMYDPNNPSANR